jgi:hypothetical protein
VIFDKKGRICFMGMAWYGHSITLHKRNSSEILRPNCSRLGDRSVNVHKPLARTPAIYAARRRPTPTQSSPAASR